MSVQANQELTAGKAAARTLQKDIRSVINVETVKRTGLILKTKVTAKKDNRSGELDRLTISSPHYSFKLHYGFEGVKENGVLMRLKGTNHFNIAIEKSNVLENLADTIGNIRADKVVAQINF